MFAQVSFVLAAAILALSEASIIAAPSAKIIQGPSSRSTIIGPDGSSISSVSPGGQIIAEDNPALVAYTAPLIRTPGVATYNAPLIHRASYNLVPNLAAYSAPLPSLAYSAPLSSLAYSAPLVHSNAVIAEKSLDTVVAGPSGTIATSKTISKPALVGEYLAPYAYSRLYI